MKKLITTLSLMFIIASILYCTCVAQIPNIKGSIDINRFHHKVLKNHISYKMEEIIIGNDNHADTLSRYIIRNSSVFAEMTLFSDIKVGEKTIEIINRDKEEVIVFEKSFQMDNNSENNYDFVLYGRIVSKHCYNIYSEYWDKKQCGMIMMTKDTLINNCKYTLYYAKSKIYESWDNTESSTYSQAKKEKQIWYIQYNICYFYNTNEGLIDKIELTAIDNVKGFASKSSIKKIIYEYSDFSYANKEKEIESIFNLNNQKYSSFLRCNDINLPSTYTVFTEEKDTVMTKEILKFPIVNTQGDTTNLNNFDGWVLLYFWFYGCPSCKDWFCQLQEEKQYSNSRELEKHNIKIVCINPFAADISRLRTESLKYGAQDIFFAAKRIDTLLYVNEFPIYYLVSPDKKIVFKHSGILENCDEIIKYVQKDR